MSEGSRKGEETSCAPGPWVRPTTAVRKGLEEWAAVVAVGLMPRFAVARWDRRLARIKKTHVVPRASQPPYHPMCYRESASLRNFTRTPVAANSVNNPTMACSESSSPGKPAA